MGPAGQAAGGGGALVRIVTTFSTYTIKSRYLLREGLYEFCLRRVLAVFEKSRSFLSVFAKWHYGGTRWHYAGSRRRSGCSPPLQAIIPDIHDNFTNLQILYLLI